MCTGPQITDESCTFTCDPGYNLTGSYIRTCQSDHTWSGEITLCHPLQCEQLTAPENSLVALTCLNEYTQSCVIICEQGYHVNGDPGSIESLETCNLADNGAVEWTNTTVCIGMLSKSYCSHYMYSQNYTYAISTKYNLILE